MPTRTIAIRITVDNKEALNAVRAQNLANSDLRASVKAASEEQRKAELHAKKLSDTTREAANTAKAQAIANKDLRDSLKAVSDEKRKAELHSVRLNGETTKLSHAQAGLTNSFIKGNLAARAISLTFEAMSKVTLSALKEVVAFDHQMTMFSALTGATTQELSNFKNLALDLSSKMPLAASEIAKAGIEMSKLGLSAEDVATSLPGIAALSTALGEDVVRTSEMVVGVLNAYNMSSDQALKVTEQVAQAAKDSALDVNKFAIAFSYVGGTAAQAGIEFEDLLGMMEVLSNAGIRTSTIGTQLRRVIADLSDENSRASKALGGMTIQSDGLENTLIGLREILAGPNGTALATELFGRTATSVISVLTNSIPKIQEFSDVNEKASGNLNKMMEIANSSLSNQWTIFWNNFKRDTIEAMDPIVKLTASMLEFSNARSEMIRYRKENKDFDKFSRDYTGYYGQKPTKEGGIDQAYKDWKAIEYAKNGGKPYDTRGLVPSYGVYTPTPMAPFSVVPKAVTPTRTPLPVGGVKPSSSGKGLSQEEKAGYERYDSLLSSFRTESFGAEMYGLKSEAQFRADGGSTLGANQFGTPENTTALLNYGGSQEHLEKMQKTLVDLGESYDNLKVKATESAEEIKGKFKEGDVELELMQITAGNLQTAFSQMGSGLTNAIMGIEGPIKNLGDIFEHFTRQMLAQLTSLIIRWMIFKAVSSMVPGMGAGGMQFLNLLTGFKASGTDEVVTKPTLMMVGESGPEKVRVTPRSRMNESENGGGLVVNINGDVYGEAKFNEAVRKANQVLRGRGYV